MVTKDRIRNPAYVRATKPTRPIVNRLKLRKSTFQTILVVGLDTRTGDVSLELAIPNQRASVLCDPTRGLRHVFPTFSTRGLYITIGCEDIAVAREQLHQLRMNKELLLAEGLLA